MRNRCTAFSQKPSYANAIMKLITESEYRRRIALQTLVSGWLSRSGFSPDNRPARELYRSPPAARARHRCVTDLMIPVGKQ
jgi:DNA gyrase inhibitor GyrI